MANPQPLAQTSAVTLWIFAVIVSVKCQLIKQCIPNGSTPYQAHTPLIPCENLPMDFLDCSEPLDLKGNETARQELGYGCTKWGGNRFEEVQMTAVNCSVLSDIECYGNRTFHREGFPCLRYSGHYFVTTLLYSILLGFLGMDRFCLGHTGTAVGKLLTVGGIGIWWVVDIVLLVTGNLMPEDGTNWMPYA
ncbi:TM2 domain-containing protein [Tropilaelaps mercedesae]|uniref:TM2 domain-containing protein n=1 Tax=Tropilaelaps mercedesae TaxID=418985 RepID=A0A1V9WZA0_9ACAR|nr:TM2 domain-containing protein [Tropilaelaps mercedesae]